MQKMPEEKKLRCSRGHEYPLNDIRYRHFEKGMRCPMQMSYDRMFGSVYCRRILQERDGGIS